MTTTPEVVSVAVGATGVPCAAEYRCPGCGRIHSLGINNEQVRPNWTWNGDRIKPTFSPSVLYQTARRDGGRMVDVVCHSFIGCHAAKPGEAIFLNDCTHANAGKTLPLPPWLSVDGVEGWDEDVPR